ncbi:fibronectin type III domain-containing protein [Paracoccus sp. Z330]|uniref:Fibronectin type III domain-containing protein n=1 Tax=Paracoccus onchidii TaxID=3017813 RepID=A0ABT4ZI82_9RHOB|nr:fibronectin type III domain-containing protein [Paracoccus onchidii]MDB6179013.1 fibronectin type III domain-containing protein [Paracoccus onchidii]
MRWLLGDSSNTLGRALETLGAGSAVLPPNYSEPAAVQAPQIPERSYTEGETITATAGVFTGSPTPIISRRWQYRHDAGWSGIADHEELSLYLAPYLIGAEIRLQEQASNIEGSTAWITSNLVGPVSEIIDPAAFTDAPSIAPGTASPGQVYSLDLGQYSGTGPITVDWSLDLDGQDVTGDVSSLSYDSTGVDDGTLTLTVRISNSANAQPVVQTATARIQTVVTAPPAPDAPTASNITHESAEISWSDLTSGGSPITRVDMQWRDASFNAQIVNDASSPETLSGLDPDSFYQVRIRATNAVGTSDWSGWANWTTEELVTIPNSGVGTDTPMMIAGGSYPVGLAYNFWGGDDGLQAGTESHGILADTRGDYAGAITSAALGETLAGVGLACAVGPQNTSQWLWNRYHGEWAEYCDPRNDLPLYSGGAFILYEGEQMNSEDWIAREITGKLAMPYVWRSNGHRVTLPRDLDYEYRLVELAAQNGVQTYIGGHWPPMVINPPDDAEWRGRFDGYDKALRYRREYLSAQLAANSLPSDVWIVPTHWIYARAYDDDQAGNLPAGIASHLDFHALENGYSAENRGHHPYMPSRLAIYCARAMIFDVVEGQDALALPDNAAEGITGTVASYLRQMAADIVSDYAPAGRGGSSYADPALLTATPARPSVALANCVGEWVTGDASVTTIASASPVHFGACIINLDDIGDLAENEQVEIMRVAGAGSSRIVFEVLNPDWRPAPIIRVEAFNEAGSYQQGTFIDAPTGGDQLIEWWITDQLTFRVVDLSLPGTDASKVNAPQYVSSAPDYISSCASFTANITESRIPITAAYASENIPTSQEQVDLNAWIDGMNPAWVAWEGEPEVVAARAAISDATATGYSAHSFLDTATGVEGTHGGNLGVLRTGTLNQSFIGGSSEMARWNNQGVEVTATYDGPLFIALYGDPSTGMWEPDSTEGQEQYQACYYYAKDAENKGRDSVVLYTPWGPQGSNGDADTSAKTEALRQWLQSHLTIDVWVVPTHLVVREAIDYLDPATPYGGDAFHMESTGDTTIALSWMIQMWLQMAEDVNGSDSALLSHLKATTWTLLTGMEWSGLGGETIVSPYSVDSPVTTPLEPPSSS